MSAPFRRGPEKSDVPRSVHVVGNIQLDVLANPIAALPPPGGDIVVDRIDIRPAGAAGNVSLALHGLGSAHRLFGLIGDDFAGRLIHDHLGGLGLAADVVVVPGGATGVSIAVETPERERAFWTAHGVLEQQTVATMAPDSLRADIVLLTGYFTVPGLRREPEATLSRARAAGATVVFDTGWDTEDWEGGARREILSLLPFVDIFLPNEAEARALTIREDPVAAALELHERCPGWVGLKLGPGGVLLVGPDGDLWRIPAPLVPVVVDTTGAGDSLSAGLVSRLALGQSVVEGLEFGVRVASTVIGRPSARRYPTADEVLPPAGPAAKVRPAGSRSAPPRTRRTP